jgi:hypothetical protein
LRKTPWQKDAEFTSLGRYQTSLKEPFPADTRKRITFRISGAVLVALRDDSGRALSRLAEREARGTREAIEAGKSERVRVICKRAERIQLAIGQEPVEQRSLAIAHDESEEV